MDNHPTAAELHRLVYGGLGEERLRTVMRHVLRGCTDCKRALAPHVEKVLGNEPLYLSAPLPPEGAYDDALDRAFAKVRALGLELPVYRSAEDKKREALALLVSGGLAALGEAPPEIQGLPIYEALLERSWALRHHDPAQMVELARGAALLADGLSDETVGAAEAAELRCRAWTELANAYRVADDLDLADEALERAARYLPGGSRDGLLGVRYFTVLASQLGARRCFEEACATLDEVAGIHRRHGDEHLAGRALVMKGIFLGYGGDPEGAVRVIECGLATIDVDRDRGLVFSALQSQAWFLVDCGRYSDARMTLLDLRRRKLDPGGRIDVLKLRWLEGHICAGLEQLDRAEQALVQVKDGFTEAGLRFKAALAGLELGAVRLRRNHYDEAVAAVLESTGVFLSLRIEREVMASVVLLRKAGELRTLTLGFLNKVIETLHQAERDPNARPQPAAEP